MKRDKKPKRKVVSHKKSLALWEKMTAEVVHEINNPLSIILAKARALHEAANGGRMEMGEVKEESERILDMVARIGKILQALRKFSRDKAQETFREVSACELVGDVALFCEDKAKTSGVRLEMTIEPDLLILKCKPIQIAQVLVNLINNAIDAASMLDQRWVRLTVLRRADEVEFDVTDSGLGIPVSQQVKIFQPYFTTKELGRGTGLGLSISYEIIRDHGGAIRYDAKSKNTRFVVTLPQKKKLNNAA